MKQSTLLLYLVFFFCETPLYSQSQDPILGKWYTFENKAIVPISSVTSTSSFEGVAIWIIQNVDRKKADRLKGKIMIKDLKKTGKNNYLGKIYVPQFDSFKSAEFNLKEDKMLTSIKIGFISKTVEWNRKVN